MSETCEETLYDQFHLQEWESRYTDLPYYRLDWKGNLPPYASSLQPGIYFVQGYLPCTPPRLFGYERLSHLVTLNWDGPAAGGDIAPVSYAGFRWVDSAATEQLERLAHAFGADTYGLFGSGPKGGPTNRIYQTCGLFSGNALMREWIRNSFTGGNHRVGVCSVEGKPAGFITLRGNPLGYVVDLIAVRPQYRGQGVGQRLLRSAIQLTRSRSLESLLTARTEEDNAAALQMYTRAGFRVVDDLDRWWARVEP